MIEDKTMAERAEPEARPTRSRISLKRMVPVAVLVLGATAFFALGVDEYVTIEALRTTTRHITEVPHDSHCVSDIWSHCATEYMVPSDQ